MANLYFFFIVMTIPFCERHKRVMKPICLSL